MMKGWLAAYTRRGTKGRERRPSGMLQADCGTPFPAPGEAKGWDGFRQGRDGIGFMGSDATHSFRSVLVFCWSGQTRNCSAVVFCDWVFRCHKVDAVSRSASIQVSVLCTLSSWISVSEVIALLIPYPNPRAALNPFFSVGNKVAVLASVDQQVQFGAQASPATISFKLFLLQPLMEGRKIEAWQDAGPRSDRTASRSTGMCSCAYRVDKCCSFLSLLHSIADG